MAPVAFTKSLCIILYTDPPKCTEYHCRFVYVFYYAYYSAYTYTVVGVAEAKTTYLSIGSILKDECHIIMSKVILNKFSILREAVNDSTVSLTPLSLSKEGFDTLAKKCLELYFRKFF